MLRTIAVATAALVGIAGCAASPPASNTGHPTSIAMPAPSRPPIDPLPGPAGDRSARLGVADGDVPGGVSVFADEYPAVANLDRVLLGAVRDAATHAKRDKITFVVNSGWRSPAYQEQLLEEAIRKYGSRRKAAEWVATPNKSAHVSGDAVDIGPTSADAWLAEHGAEYGLCPTYANEPWHYELRPSAIDRGCPRPYADPAHDPRMQ